MGLFVGVWIKRVWLDNSKEAERMLKESNNNERKVYWNKQGIYALKVFTYFNHILWIYSWRYLFY